MSCCRGHVCNDPWICVCLGQLLWLRRPLLQLPYEAELIELYGQVCTASVAEGCDSWVVACVGFAAGRAAFELASEDALDDLPSLRVAVVADLQLILNTGATMWA